MNRTTWRTLPQIIAALALLTLLPGGVRAQESAASGGSIALTIWLCNEPTPDPYANCQSAGNPDGPVSIHGPVELTTDAARIHGISWVWGEEESLPFGNYYVDPRTTTPPAGYWYGEVVGSYGGSDIGWLVVLDEATPNAMVALTFVASQAEPVDADGDGDSLTDERELELGTDPANPDTDEDGLFDGKEVDEVGADPLVYDTDGDGFGDNNEVVTGTDPLDPNSTPDGEPVLDSDGDGLADATETELGTDPNNPDSDADGLSDFDEVGFEPGSGTGTDPLDADTDDDRLSDGFEVREFGTDPLTWDSDGDGLGDGDELEVYGSDALDPDSRPRDDEPAETPTTPAAVPVKSLPNTGAGALAAGGADDAALQALLVSAAIVSLGWAARAARRWASPTSGERLG